MSDSHALLVVDDEEVICQACRRIFSRQALKVDTNTDARQGLSWAAEKEYQIILLDIKMPSMDGIQFLEELRQAKLDVPVLIITGYPSIPNAAAAMRLGACDYVTKPDFGIDPGDAAGKITTLAVQPDAMGGIAGFDARTTAALADHIVREMAVY